MSSRVCPNHGTGILNPSQKIDAIEILSRTKNEHRLATMASWLGMHLHEFYARAGFDTQAVKRYRTHKGGIIAWQRREALVMAFDFAKFLGLEACELWEIDDGWDPVQSVPLNIFADMQKREKCRAATKLQLIKRRA